MRLLAIEKLKPITLMDWEFVNSDTSYATHDFHRYSSKFIPQIASNYLYLFRGCSYRKKNFKRYELQMGPY